MKAAVKASVVARKIEAGKIARGGSRGPLRPERTAAPTGGSETGWTTSRAAAAVTLAVEIVVIAGLVLVAFTALPEALGARNARRRGPDLFGAVAGYAAGARGSRSEGSM